VGPQKPRPVFLKNSDPNSCYHLFTLVTSLGVIPVEQRLARAIASQIPREKSGEPFIIMHTITRNMGRQNHIRQCKQRAVSRQWFLRCHVESSSSNPSLL